MASAPSQTRLDGLDTSSLSEKDLRIFRLYGRLPAGAKPSRSSSLASSTSTSPSTSPPNSGSSLQSATTTSSTTANAATTRFTRHLKDRKYFDSGDYALSKAGRGNSVDVGTIGSAHPAPEQIPHPSPLSIMQRRRGSSVCSGVSGSVPGLGGMGGFEDEEVMGELPGFGGGGGGWGCWSRNGNGNGAGNGRYRRSSLSAAVMGAGGGFDEDGEEGGGGGRR
ncbi:hypothetical protein SMACR_00515 [Sordaria macrospora]|uniref:mRNA stability protein n=2 Tax=Sordaria macrospora TaxID=5147 RepID=F7VLC1_SORMK|nr:uncharacterized protein SMAC_00515 [Sordaria macrospora k-hell]KAA8635419.1 hypothetical protein SMACR_00515 [Sordaria macrospora]KAH7627518.1 hypothetical protein B0T09DRAFT_185235 [Sordaria sp. MPI-SDFR-AT-0083]WPJ59266.1 hypothetical protein SMAC4_00515 [Sordaria macrospora]CCC06298.1 unnamed protein product [Sordaria macrospora k-hell]